MDITQKLLDILVEGGKITQQQAEEVKFTAFNSNKKITEVLLGKHWVNADDILQATASVYDLPLVKLTGLGISPEILNLIPEPVARKYKLIPFEIDKTSGKLRVAMVDPLNLPTIEFLEQKSGKSIMPYLAGEDDIALKIDEEYSRSLVLDVSEALKQTVPGSVKTIQAEEIGKIIKEAPIAKIVSTVLEYAVRNRASDIHIEPQENRTRIRFRIDGVLYEKLALPSTVHDAVLSRIKIIAGMKIDEKRLPQDGRFNFKLDKEEIDLRVSTLATVFGEKVVLRLLRKTGGVPDLPNLGLTGTSLKSLENAITRPHGIILITGPTGSGKTTTLYSILSRLNTPRVNIVTLEDPVEYELEGLNQVQINPQAGLSFASGIRSILRQDPNIILVGEIRDKETTTLAVQAALTGHLVLSTLHTNNAATAIPRLLDLGAEPFLIVTVLIAVEAQRIVRRICHSCRYTHTGDEKTSEDIKRVLGKFYPGQNNPFLSKGLILYKGKGCKECNNTGYLGRIGIFETIIISPAISRLIIERATESTIEKQAVAEGMITLMQDGFLKVLSGITTIEEILRVSQE